MDPAPPLVGRLAAGISVLEVGTQRAFLQDLHVETLGDMLGHGVELVEVVVVVRVGRQGGLGRGIVFVGLDRLALIAEVIPPRGLRLVEVDLFEREAVLIDFVDERLAPPQGVVRLGNLVSVVVQVGQAELADVGAGGPDHDATVPVGYKLRHLLSWVCGFLECVFFRHSNLEVM